MPRFILLTLLAWVVVRSDAQQQYIDSILVLMKEHPQEDTIRLGYLNDLAFYYYQSDPREGLKVADQAIALAMKLGHQAKLASAYSNKGVNYYAEGEDSLALSMYGKALQVYAGIRNRSGMARTYNNMAMIYAERSDYPQALDTYGKALEELKRYGDSANVASLYSNLGVVYLRMADYPKALDYYLHALGMYEKLTSQVSMANTLSNIGIVYKSMANFPLALQYHERALKIYEAAGNLQGKANCLANMGVVYDEMNHPQQSLPLYRQALAINEKIGNNRRIASDLTNIALVYKAQHDYTRAMPFLLKALHLYEQTEDKNSMATVLDEIGHIYSQAPAAMLPQLPVTAAGRYAAALQYQQRSLQLATEIGAIDRQANVWEHLSETYAAKGDYQKALTAYKQFTLLQDSIMNDKKAAEIARKETQFEYEKKQAVAQAGFAREQALSAAALNRQRLIKRALIAGLGGLLLGAAWVFVFYKRSRDAEARKKEAEFQSHVADTEMKVMRLQMNPHFIFNSLNAISDYIARNDHQAADLYLTKFAKVMRMILENSEQQEVPLEEDLKALTLYIQLESLRLTHPFAYEIIVDSDIDAANTLIPPLILQPFVENSIWHGLSGKQSAGKITIRVQKAANMLFCVVEDDGVGRQTAPAGDTGIRKKSLGMKITKSRIDIINKMKQTNAGVELIDLEEGTRVVLRLPLELID